MPVIPTKNMIARKRTLLFILVLAACGPSPKNERSLPPAFETFITKYPEASLPANWSNETLAEPATPALAPADATGFLGVDAMLVAPVSMVPGTGYFALLSHVQWDEMDASLLATFFDMEGKRQSQVVLSGATYEVPDHYAYVEHATWEGNTIRRKLEYHYGNDAAASQYADVVTAIEANGILVQTPEKIGPSLSTTGDTSAAGRAEIVTYLSPDMHGVEITGIFPFEDAPVYLVHANQKTRKLILNDDPEVASSTAVVTDEDFLAIDFSGAAELNGIQVFQSLVLEKKNNETVTFQHAFVKRPPAAIGNAYAYNLGEEKGYGKLTFTEIDPTTLSFTSDISTGAPQYHVCDIAGTIMRRNNIGYFQADGGVERENCKLAFVFLEKQVAVFQVSDNVACGCGMNATLEGTYAQEP